MLSTKITNPDCKFSHWQSLRKLIKCNPSLLERKHKESLRSNLKLKSDSFRVLIYISLLRKVHRYMQNMTKLLFYLF